MKMMPLYGIPGVTNAHNIYLEMALQTGVIGLFVFLGMAVRSCYGNRRASCVVTDRTQKESLVYLFLVLLGFLSVGFFDPNFSVYPKMNDLFWLFCGLSLAASGRALRRDAPRCRRRSAAWARRGLLGRSRTPRRVRARPAFPRDGPRKKTGPVSGELPSRGRGCSACARWGSQGVARRVGDRRAARLGAARPGKLASDLRRCATGATPHCGGACVAPPFQSGGGRGPLLAARDALGAGGARFFLATSATRDCATPSRPATRGARAHPPRSRSPLARGSRVGGSRRQRRLARRAARRRAVARVRTPRADRDRGGATRSATCGSTWEIGRCTHVVRLAQAAWLSRDPVYGRAVGGEHRATSSATNPPGTRHRLGPRAGSRDPRGRLLAGVLPGARPRRLRRDLPSASGSALDPRSRRLRRRASRRSPDHAQPSGVRGGGAGRSWGWRFPSCAPPSAGVGSERGCCGARCGSWSTTRASRPSTRPTTTPSCSTR